ncbi:two-component sensor histidine kinase [Micromonospora sp. PPF5-17]|uniref:Sensor-like histidine kinase SenX3 n=1 Tax=Micromonospora solifontis TaxID=2487138 RepID=A0ABX9WL94_9ACTN|nr:two-component sensor histidine kinase [Micromonospora sp. PPF5-17B]NES35937.1 two-component sensor histidine kinase [Micromonospora solifontis]NES56990.1 two-component sensor histidine kinase [Micromonospora sp. PPF5-6]RNM00127.1 two-component sensor histidine kinase [Micromonospora solifontis]
MAAGVAVALVAGLVAGLLLSEPVRAWWRRSASGGESFRRSAGRPLIPDDELGGLSALGRKTIDSLRAGVVVLAPDDTPVLVNPAARAMGLLRTGTTPGSIAAHPLIRTLAGQVRRTGVRREIELDLPRGRDSAGDNPLGVHLRAMGLGAGYVSIEAADVTESHRLARVRRDFVANVSHELKTPIGALQLLAEALVDATEPAGGGAADLSADLVAARRFAERIQHESTRLGRLVQELLELTRLQGAEPQPAPEPVAVDWVIAEVLDRTRTAAAARRVEIAVDGQRGLTVYGSDSQLATAVANLVENAINYSGEDTMVRVTARATDEHVEIAVADQGIGIAPNEVDRIFERFYRADQARSRATGGTGLGLAIVKHIASNHGGRVDVSSTLGGGSTFTLRLPARPPDDLEATLNSAEIEAGPAELRQV